DILEVPIHRREAHERHFVEMPQLLHHELTHRARLNFPLSQSPNLVKNAAERCIDRLATDGPLFERLLHPAANFVLIERLAGAIRLHDDGHDQLRRLERGEALAAAQALAATAHLPPFAREARVRDFGVYVAAEGAIHRAATLAKVLFAAF